MRIKEIIVVEGRDDQNALNRAVEAESIATHGYGISKNTWDLIEKAYKTRGIIIFTDPDFAGNEIRKRIKAKFPKAKEAFLSREEATKASDIGIENANPESIIGALKKAKCSENLKADEFNMKDLVLNRLAGVPEASERRKQLGTKLGIGYGNTKAFLKKLNSFDIERKDFVEKIGELDSGK